MKTELLKLQHNYKDTMNVHIIHKVYSLLSFLLLTSIVYHDILTTTIHNRSYTLVLFENSRSALLLEALAFQHFCSIA